MNLKNSWCSALVWSTALASILMAGSVAAEHKQPHGYKFRATDIIGVDVVNLENDTIGEIDDLIISESDGLLYAVLSVGGFLNLGEKLVTVPYDQLQISKNEENNQVYVQYNATEEQLEALDTFVYKDGEMTWKSQQEQRREELIAELKQQQEELQEEKQDIAEERQDVKEIKQQLQETRTQ